MWPRGRSGRGGSPIRLPGRFRPDPVEIDLRRRPLLAWKAGAKGFRYRGSGDVQTPPARRRGKGLSRILRGRFSWIRKSGARGTKKRDPESGTCCRVCFFCGVCGDEYRSAERENPIADLIQSLQLGRPSENLDFGRRQDPAGGTSSPDRARSGPKTRCRAVARAEPGPSVASRRPWKGRSLLPAAAPATRPGLGRRPPSSGSAAATAFPRIGLPIRRAGSCRMRGGIRTRINDSEKARTT